jgi:hypothetical protein
VDLDLLGDNVGTIKESRTTLIDASKEIYLEVNVMQGKIMM